MCLPLKIQEKTYKNPHLSFGSQNFSWAGCQGCPSSPNAQLAKNGPKKPKMYLPLKIQEKTYKNTHLSFWGQYFLWAGCQGCPTSPNAQLAENAPKKPKMYFPPFFPCSEKHHQSNMSEHLLNDVWLQGNLLFFTSFIAVQLRSIFTKPF